MSDTDINHNNTAIQLDQPTNTRKPQRKRKRFSLRNGSQSDYIPMKLIGTPHNLLEQRLHSLIHYNNIQVNNSKLMTQLQQQHNYILPSIDLLHHINSQSKNMLHTNNQLSCTINNKLYWFRPKYNTLDSSVCVTIGVLLEEYVNKQVLQAINNK